MIFGGHEDLRIPLFLPVEPRGGQSALVSPPLASRLAFNMATR